MVRESLKKKLKTPNLCSSLNVCDQVSHPHTTTGIIIVPNGLNPLALELDMFSTPFI